VPKVSEKQVLESVESLESRIKSLIKEKDQLYIEYQSLKEENQIFEAELQKLETQKERAKNKVEDVLERLNQIETSA
jgi:regulator of replication initiation timing